VRPAAILRERILTTRSGDEPHQQGALLVGVQAERDRR
jgi:hypothetical protein